MRSIVPIVVCGLWILTGCGGGGGPVANVDPPHRADLSLTDPQVAELIERLLAEAEAEPGSPERRGALAMAYDVNGLLQAAATTYRQAIGLQPEEPRWSYYLALVEAKLGHVDAALARLDAVNALEPQYVSAWIHRGRWLIDVGRADDAETAFRHALQLDPANAPASIGLARALLRRNEPQQALKLLEPLASSRPDDGYLHQLLGLAHRDAGDLDRARAALARSKPTDEPPVWFDPWHEEKAAYQAGFGAGMRKADALLEHGRSQEAVAVLESLLESRPSDRALLNNLSVAYRRAGQPDRAFEILLRGVEVHPDFYPFHMNLAANYERRGEVERALQHLDEVIRINPRLGTAYERKGRLMLRQRRLEEALDAFDSALIYDATNAASFLYAGVLEAELGRWEAAGARLEQALRIDPGLGAAHVALARARAERGRLDEATAALTAAERAGADPRQITAVRERMRELQDGAR